MNRKGRPKMEKSKKKESLIYSAKEIFRQHGFHKVSVDEICERAKVSKMTFYRHFEDKSTLIVAILDVHFKKIEVEFERILSEKVPFHEKFEKTLELNDLSRRELGLAFSEELGQSTDPKLAEAVKDLAKKFTQTNLRFIKEGQKEGFLNPQFRPEFIFFIVDKFNAMFRDPELTKIYPDFKQRVKNGLDFFYFGITTRKKVAAS